MAGEPARRVDRHGVCAHGLRGRRRDAATLPARRPHDPFSCAPGAGDAPRSGRTRPSAGPEAHGCDRGHRHCRRAEDRVRRASKCDRRLCATGEVVLIKRVDKQRKSSGAWRLPRRPSKRPKRKSSLPPPPRTRRTRRRQRGLSGAPPNLSSGAEAGALARAQVARDSARESFLTAVAGAAHSCAPDALQTAL